MSAHPRPFRFSVQERSAYTARPWRDRARAVESMGYSTLYLPDHFGDQLGPIAALMAAADATTTLRIGSLVFDNDYRHPVVLAKEAATLDLLSEGRLDFGIGAGWMVYDYEQSGIPFDSAGTRIDRLAEGLTIIKRLFAGGEVSFAGRHYSISGIEGAPLPVQKPHPPIVIGGGGRKMLELAAREANTVNVNFDLRAGRPGRRVAHWTRGGYRREARLDPSCGRGALRFDRAWGLDLSGECHGRSRLGRRHARTGDGIRDVGCARGTPFPDRHGRSDRRRPGGAARAVWDLARRGSGRLGRIAGAGRGAPVREVETSARLVAMATTQQVQLKGAV